MLVVAVLKQPRRTHLLEHSPANANSHGSAIVTVIGASRGNAIDNGSANGFSASIHSVIYLFISIICNGSANRCSVRVAQAQGGSRLAHAPDSDSLKTRSLGASCQSIDASCQSLGASWH